MNPSLPSALFALSLLPASAFQRDLSPDRPDTTESPVSVEQGAFQVESTLWSFTKERSSETWSLGETNFKYGLTSSADLQLVLAPWIHEDDAEGFGDIAVRMKYNLWGNDGGKTAAALMPWISIPTHTAVSSGEWEGGLIFPVAVELTDKLGLSFQLETARVWNNDDAAYDWTLGHSVSLGISVTDKLGLFVEYVGLTGGGAYEAIANTGLTWSATENLQWDIAIGIGLSDAADDFSIAQGVTFRF